jgi:hypothetical protein
MPASVSAAVNDPFAQFTAISLSPIVDRARRIDTPASLRTSALTTPRNVAYNASGRSLS